MNTKFIPPELQDTVVGLDGQQVIVDQHGNIIG